MWNIDEYPQWYKSNIWYMDYLWVLHGLRIGLDMGHIRFQMTAGMHIPVMALAAVKLTDF